jgi:hypothetical protein
VREGRNRAHAAGQVLILHAPPDPLSQPWRITQVADFRGNDVLQVASGDFDGDGHPNDVAIAVATHRDASQPSFTGLHVWLAGRTFGSWRPLSLSSAHTAAVGAFDFDGDGLDELLAMQRSQDRVELWHRHRTDVFTLRATHPFIKGDDWIGFSPFDDQRGFYLGSDPNGLYWFEVVVPRERPMGMR